MCNYVTIVVVLRGMVKLGDCTVGFGVEYVGSVVKKRKRKTAFVLSMVFRGLLRTWIILFLSEITRVGEGSLPHRALCY